MKGYMGKVLMVDLSKGSTEVREVVRGALPPAFRDGRFRLASDLGPIRSGQHGTTLREAALHAGASFFPPSGKTPDPILFTHPQFNTWIELTYDQNQRDVLAYARLLENPRDEAAFARVVNAPRRGAGDGSVERIRAHATARGISVPEAAAEKVEGVPARARAGLDRFHACLARLRLLPRSPLGPLFQAVVTETGYREDLLSREDDLERSRVENVDELVAAAHEADRTTPGLPCASSSSAPPSSRTRTPGTYS